MKNILNIHELSDDLLITLGLKVSEKYNNVAGLVSDLNPIENSVIQLIAYSSDSVIEIKDRKTVENTSVIKQYEICMDFYRKHINMGEIIDGPYRKTVEEIL